MLEKAIERFVIRGTNSKYMDNKRDIIKILKYNLNEYSTGIHFSGLFCQSQAKNLNYNPLYEKKRYCVQVKWYSLFDDIILNMYLKNLLKTANMGSNL